MMPIPKLQKIFLYFVITFFLFTIPTVFSSSEAFQSLIDCETLGYPHDFCLRIPLEALPESKSKSVLLNVGDLL